MSLLLDALKQAEASKRAKLLDKAESTPAASSPTVAIATIESSETKPAPSKLLLEMSLLDVVESSKAQAAEPVVPASANATARNALSNSNFTRDFEPALPTVAPATPSKPAAPAMVAIPTSANAPNRLIIESRDEVAEREAVKNSFASKQRDADKPNRKWLIPLLAFILAVLGGGGWYVWNQMNRYNGSNLAKLSLPPRPISATPAATAIPDSGSALAANQTATNSPTPQMPQTPITAGTLAASATLPLANSNTGQALKNEANESAGHDAQKTVAPLLPPEVKEPAPLPTTQTGRANANTLRANLANTLKESKAAGTPAVALKLATTIAPTQPNADLVSAYDALRTGDYASAQQRYKTLVESDPLNLDAQLGFATAAARRGDRDTAMEHYRRTLDIDPRNGTAIAGLAMLNAQSSPAASEIELKTMIAKTPTSGGLQFSLGNLYATQKRWSEAQQAYFEAYRLDEANADFAFNLAVSLDQLGQTRLALEYYQKALVLGAKSITQFDPSVALRRVAQLGNANGDTNAERR